MFREKQRSIFAGLAFGVFALFPYIAVIVLADSLTVLAEILKNVALLLAVFMSWLALRKVARGNDPYYEYGYGKMENLQSLAVALILMVATGIVLYEVVHRLQHPVPFHEVGVAIGIGAAAISAIGNAYLWRHDHHLAKREASPVMDSLWRLYRTKTIASLCVFLALGLSMALRDYHWAEYIDPVGSIVVLCILMYTAYGIISMSVYDLLDGTLEESLQLTILRELAAHFDKYETIHGIRSRRSGSNVYVELFLEFDGNQTMSEVQQVIDEIRSALERRIPASHVVIAPTTSPPR